MSRLQIAAVDFDQADLRRANRALKLRILRQSRHRCANDARSVLIAHHEVNLRQAAAICGDGIIANEGAGSRNQRKCHWQTEQRVALCIFDLHEQRRRQLCRFGYPLIVPRYSFDGRRYTQSCLHVKSHRL